MTPPTLSNSSASQSPRVALHIIIEGPHRVSLVDQPWPTPAENEVVVRTIASLVSPGTELALYEGTHSALADPEIPFAKYPFRPGYSAVGEVVAVGARVTATRLGQRIFFFGQHASCSLLRPASSVWVEVSGDHSLEHLLLMRLVQIAATASHRWRRQPSRVLVLGAGLIGLLAAQVCRIRGIREIAIQDINSARLALAARCGVTTGLLANGNLVPANPRVFGDEAPDCIIEATGVPALVPAALRGVRRGGDVILLGSPRGAAQIDLYRQVHQKNVALIGAHDSMLPGRTTDGLDGSLSQQDVIQEALGWLRSGALKLDGLVSHTIRPQDLPEVYARMATDKTGTLGVMVDWT